MLFSAIIPCYNESENIMEVYNEICKQEDFLMGRGFETEFVFVDDGSTDDTLLNIKKLIEKDSRVHVVSFSRNFGKEAAMFAGLCEAKGDYVAIMDADLQDPPALLPKLFEAVLDEGYDSAATRRVNRKGEPPIRSFFARRFYKLMRKISKTELMDGARDYRLMCRKMVNAIIEVKEYNRFSKGIFSWVGFNTKWIEFENVERRKGETKWSFWGLFKYSLEGIMAFSTAPLAFASIVGLIFTVVAFLAIVFIIVRTLVFGDPTNGWPSMACIVVFVAGVQLFCLGVVGQYLSKVYLEVKNRPQYIVKEKI